MDFVNGLPSLSCALVSTYDDLADGKAVVEAAQHVLGCSEADAHASLEALSGVDAGRLERCEVRAQLDALDALRRKRQTPSGPVPRAVTTAPHARDKRCATRAATFVGTTWRRTWPRRCGRPTRELYATRPRGATAVWSSWSSPLACCGGAAPRRPR